MGTERFAVLDMSPFWSTPKEKEKFCVALLHELKENGFAKIRNHGIPAEKINQIFEMARNFFDLTHEDKMKAKRPLDPASNRGYSYVGEENSWYIRNVESSTALEKSHDILESFDMGAEDDELRGNIWIDRNTLPGFQESMESFFKAAFAAQLSLLSAIAQALGISDTHLCSLHSRAENDFRLAHYPMVPVAVLEDTSATRKAPHTDFGTITMLFQDATGGLQVEDQNRKGEFHDIESSDATEMILNIGDSLQRLTNDTFRAACHRVSFPPPRIHNGQQVIPGRYSVAYFAKPNRNASLLPFREFLMGSTACHYDDITSGEWNNLRMGKLYS